MKVQFLKQHLNYKKDGVYDVENGLGQYLISMKVAKAGKGEEPEAEETKEKVVKPQVKEKNEKPAPVKKAKKK